MRVLVCGGRDFENRDDLYGALNALLQRTPHDTLEIIQGGCATGADSFARDWCEIMAVPYINVPAEWRKHKKSAGPIRNQKMIDKYAPDLVMAFPGGRGTADMIFRAENACIPIQRPTDP